MDIEAVTESIWQHTLRRSYFPAEWKGRLTIDQAYRVQLGSSSAGWRGASGWRGEGRAHRAGDPEAVRHARARFMGLLFESGHRDSGVRFRHADLIAAGLRERALPDGRLPPPGIRRHAGAGPGCDHRGPAGVRDHRGSRRFSGRPTLGSSTTSQQKAVRHRAGKPLLAGWEPAQTTVEVFINGQRVDHVIGSEETGHPLSGRLARQEARLVRPANRGRTPDHVGPFTKQYPISRGDSIETRFTPFGAVKAFFD